VAAVEACNHRIDDNAGMFIPTPKMQGAVDRADAAARAVNQICLDTVSTPDLPDDVLIHVLRVRVLYTVGAGVTGARRSARWAVRASRRDGFSSTS
jgi:hypothetical protein